jgi:hypothetical protein
VSLALIQALYNLEEPLPQEPAFYEEAWEDIAHFQVAPQVWGILKAQGRLWETPEFFQARLRAAFDTALGLSAWILIQQKRLLLAFEDAGIPVIPLKGVRFADKYFGHIGCRVTSDIDLLIPQERMDAAVRVVKSQGFTDEEPLIPGHFHVSLSRSIPGSAFPLTVELHWNVLKEGTSELPIVEFWKDAVPLSDYKHVMELSEHHTLYMMVLHGWRHNLDSLRHIIDIAQLLHKQGEHVDYARLWRDAAAHKTKRRLRRTLAIIFHHIPQVAPHGVEARSLWWSYRTIRYREQKTLAAYVYWFYYECGDYDTARHTVKALFHWVCVTWKQLRLKKAEEVVDTGRQ